MAEVMGPGRCGRYEGVFFSIKMGQLIMFMC